MRPSSASSIQAANASRAAVATLWLTLGSTGTLDSSDLPFDLTGAGDDQRSHRGVGADGRPVEDGLLARCGSSHGHFTGQAEVFGNSLAGMPALGYKDRNHDDVLRLDVLHDLGYLRLLVKESFRDDVVEAALPYARGVEVDHPAGALVQVGTVPEQDKRRAAGADDV